MRSHAHPNVKLSKITPLSNGNECYDVRSVSEVHFIPADRRSTKENCVQVTKISFKQLLHLPHFKKLFLFIYILTPRRRGCRVVDLKVPTMLTTRVGVRGRTSAKVVAHDRRTIKE